MGSDYQRVKVLEVAAPTIVLEVTENHPDADAIHRILSKKGAEYLPKSLKAPIRATAIPKAKAFEARNFAAQLLSDYGETPFLAAVERFVEEELLEPDPDAFLREVTIRALTPLEQASNESWLYRATLVITLRDPALCAGFKVGRRYAGRAFPTGDWELV